MNATLSFESSDLASRSIAAKKRETAITLLQSHKRIEFDFTGVESISSSYADELFGILTQQFGLEEATKKVHLKNCNDSCAREIAEAMYRRANNKLCA